MSKKKVADTAGAAPKKYEFENPNSRIEVQKDAQGRLYYTGTVIRYGIKYPYTIHPATSGGYAFHCYMRVRDPATGRYVSRTGKERDEIVDRYKKMDKDPSRALIIVRESFTNETDIAGIKKLADDTAAAMDAEYGGTIKGYTRRSVTPETCKLDQAVYVYGDEYLAGSKCAEDRVKRKRNTLQKLAVLPKMSDKPMAEMSPATVNNALSSVTDDQKRLLRSFWAWMIKRGYLPAKSNNPVLVSAKKRNPKTRQNQSKVQERLDQTQQDAVYEHAMRKPSGPDGADCGVALVKGSNTTMQNAAVIKWGQLDIDFVHRHIVIRCIKDGDSGATRDYSQPMFPQGEAVLFARLDALMEKYAFEELRGMYVVSTKDGTKPLGLDALRKNAKRILIDAGVGNDVFFYLSEKGVESVASRLLRATYEHNVTCELGAGIVQHSLADFLLGKSLSHDTTANHYTSFTCPEARSVIRARMGLCAPLKENSATERHTKMGDNMWDTYLPPDNRTYLTLSTEYILQPGETVVTSSQHGLAGIAYVRPIRPDGKPERLIHNTPAPARQIDPLAENLEELLHAELPDYSMDDLLPPPDSAPAQDDTLDNKPNNKPDQAPGDTFDVSPDDMSDNA